VLAAPETNPQQFLQRDFLAHVQLHCNGNVQGFPSCSQEELVISSQDLVQQMQLLLCRVIDRQKDKRMQLLMGRRKAF
jgi:hypothetical protein